MLKTDDLVRLAGQDTGGGLENDGRFLILTHTRGVTLGEVVQDDRLWLEKLRRLTDDICKRLEILTSSQQLHDHPIKALKYTSDAPGIPWFFVNAARSSRHCIVGTGTASDTLISVLQRPWCALEICCIRDVWVVEKLLAFAKLLSEVNPFHNVIRPALSMLEAELRHRTLSNAITVENTWLSYRAPMSRLDTRIRDTSSIIFAISLSSRKGTWLCAIFTMLVALDTSIGTIAASLASPQVSVLEARVTGFPLGQAVLLEAPVLKKHDIVTRRSQSVPSKLPTTRDALKTDSFLPVPRSNGANKKRLPGPRHVLWMYLSLLQEMVYI